MLNKRGTARLCSQLKMLLGSGVPLLEALGIIKGLIPPKNGGRISAVIEKINQGHSLSEATADWLPPLATGSIRAAERSGELETTLGTLAKYFEEKAELEERLIGSLIYPVFVLMLCLFSVLALIFLVMPGLKSVFNDLGADLPPLTSAILGLSDLFSRYGIALALVIVVLGGIIFRQLERGGWEKQLIKIPLIRKLFFQEMIIHGFGTLGALLNSGLSMMEALTVTANSSRNRIFKQVILQAQAGIENGGKLSDSLGEGQYFPAETVQMLRIGEDAGKLAAMLINIAHFQSKERESAIKRITTLFEPVMTLSVGVVVGVVVMSLFLPLISMISNIK